MNVVSNYEWGLSELTLSMFASKLQLQLIAKQLFLIVFELRLRSKWLQYLRRKRQRKRFKIIAAQALSQVK